ncbi:MAG: MBOAT family O-acyltransferase, partial [Halioglobus sp.]
MLFNSTEYLFLFLPVVLVVFLLLSRGNSTEGQISWLILASLYFYGSWNPVYLLLILSSIVVNFLVGRKLAATQPSGRHKWLLFGMFFNLGLLGYFKYAGFFVDSLNTFGNWLIPVPEITLPLAISFFTFQQIAYLVDVSRNKCQEYLFRHYALFVLFFPQLIAGPIVHHKEIMPQFTFLRPSKELRTDLSVGLTIIVIGLFKKVVMADSLAEISNPIYDAAAQGQAINTLDAWIATLGFSFQIYFDFSGYSDIAIGSARLFGIKLPENFRSPYKARSAIDIWNRWHITLSRFLKDYLYIALGGNRHGTVRRYRNLFMTMLLGGLWHGAAWTYVIWGGLHGLFL